MFRQAWTAYQALEQIGQYQRVRRSEREAQEAQAFLLNPEASEKLGAGRLGTLADAQAENMLDPNGLFLGRLDSKPVFYNGDAHLMNYGLTRSGKGRDIILPNLAHVFNRSLVVSDIKDGENHFASAEYRAKKGNRIIALNPHNLRGAESHKLNPFQRIIDKAGRGQSVTEDCLQICMSLVPPSSGDSGNDWVASGVQQILATWLEWSARFRPERCTLSNMWRFVFRDMTEHINKIVDCDCDGLAGQAEKFAQISESPDQWNAYETELTKALWNFRPDGDLAKVTEETTFNPADMKHEKMTVYLMADSDLLEASSRWVSLTVSSIINTCAQEAGAVPVTFIIDELANLPYMAVIPKALTLYAGKGVQLWGLCQGREALRDRGYSDHTIKNFEGQSGILHVWSVKDTDLLRDIELWSGKKAVALRGVNQGGGQVASASFGVSEQARPVLQTEDILGIGEGKQLVRTNGAHMYLIDRVPWYEVPSWTNVLEDVRTLTK